MPHLSSATINEKVSHMGGMGKTCQGQCGWLRLMELMKGRNGVDMTLCVVVFVGINEKKKKSAMACDATRAARTSPFWIEES
jgi:hypothetical protein